MSESDYTTLEGQAVEEILKEAKRSKELAKDFGALAWQKRDVLPNKRFLNNTLVSTLRHSFRQEQKHKTGSYHKYKEHIESQHKKRRSNFQTIREKQKEETSDLNKPEPDYGEFDAIAYADKCTDLYIRDSHRKHSRMKDQFVEKVHKSDSSESEESFTEYDDLTESKRPYDGHEDKVKDFRSCYGYDDKTKHQYSRKSRHDHQSEKYISDFCDASVSTNSLLTEKKKEIKSSFFSDDRFCYKSSGNYNRKEKNRRKVNYPEASSSKLFDRYANSEPDCSKSHSDCNNISNETESVNSGSESADDNYMNKLAENFAKKKSRKLFKNGKDLAAIISSRSMYADIEELKMVKGNKDNAASYDPVLSFRKNDMEAKMKWEDLIKEEKERRKTLIERRTEKLRLEKEKDSAFRKKDGRIAKYKNAIHKTDVRGDLSPDEIYNKGYHRNGERFIEQGLQHQRNSDGQPVNRSRPFLSGHPAGGFDLRGFSMYSPMNPFYTSYMYDMDPYLLGKFIQEHGHKFMRTSRNYQVLKSYSRSRSRSMSRPRKLQKKWSRQSSHGDGSSSRCRYEKYGRSRRSLSRNSSSCSRSRSRSYSRRHHRYKHRHRTDSRRRHRTLSKRRRSSNWSYSRRSRSRSIDVNYRSRKYDGGVRSHSHSKSSYSDSDQSSSSRKSIDKKLIKTLKQKKSKTGSELGISFVNNAKCNETFEEKINERVENEQKVSLFVQQDALENISDGCSDGWSSEQKANE